MNGSAAEGGRATAGEAPALRPARGRAGYFVQANGRRKQRLPNVLPAQGQTGYA